MPATHTGRHVPSSEGEQGGGREAERGREESCERNSRWSRARRWTQEIDLLSRRRSAKGTAQGNRLCSSCGSRGSYGSGSGKDRGSLYMVSLQNSFLSAGVCGGIPTPPIGTLVYPPTRRSSKCNSAIRTCTERSSPWILGQHAAWSSNVLSTSSC